MSERARDPARMDLPQYSVEALFEALVNAVAHRDYSIRGSRIRLSMFADRLEIDSPGGLPNNLTIDAMAARQSTWNEAIASVLGRVPVGDIPGSGQRRYFMERRGDGVPVIFRETRALCGRSPSYRLLGESNLFLDIPAATTAASPATVVVTVHHAGGPVAGADVLARASSCMEASTESRCSTSSSAPGEPSPSLPGSTTPRSTMPRSGPSAMVSRPAICCAFFRRAS